MSRIMALTPVASPKASPLWRRPFSCSSMAKPSVTPRLMLSIPRSSASSFHSLTQRRSVISRFGPSSAAVSYSGPLSRPTPSTVTSRPQATGQWMQLDLTPTRPWSSRYSPETLMASGWYPSLKLRVGMMFRALVVLTMPMVP